MAELIDLKPLDFAATHLVPLSYSPKTGEWLIGDDCGQLRNALDTSSKSYEISSAIECLGFNKTGNICTSSFEGIVKAVSFPDTSDEIVDVIHRFPSQVLSIQHIDGVVEDFILMSSKDPNIIVYSMKSKSVKCIIKTDALSEIKTFSVNSSGTYMAVIGCDGSVHIFSMSLEDGVNTWLETKSSLVPKIVIDDKNTLAYRPNWNPNCDSDVQVAIPSTEGVVVLLTKNNDDIYNWKVSYLNNSTTALLTHNNNDINLTSFSSNGKYLASADIQGTVLIWDVATQEPIKQLNTQSKTPLVDIAWGRNIDDQYLVILSKTGASKVNDVLPLKSKGGKVTNTVTQNKETRSSEGGDVTSTTGKSMRRLHKSSGKEINNNGAVQNDGKVVPDDDDMMFEESVEEIKKQTLGTLLPVNQSSDQGGQLMDLEADGDEDFIDDDNNGGMVFAPSSHPLQEAFQPSSTALDDKKQRYLVWNSIGSITSREETISNRIEIKFSNTSGANKQEAFPDNYGFTLASLSYEGAFFASPAEETETEEQKEDTSRPGSTLYYHAFRDQTVLQGANESFTVTLNNLETAVAVAVGRGWAAVVTSRNFLRVFSSTGIQLAVLALSGPILCLAGYESKLAILYHTSSVAGDTPDITVDVMQVGGANSHQGWRDICRARVPVSTGCKLTWAGWSTDEAYLLVMDSDGLLFALLRCGGWRWVPVLDSKQTRKSVDHKFWPIGVKNNKLLCVLLNGESRPAVHPQPVVCNRPFTMLVVESKEGKDRGSSFNEKCRQMMWDSLKANHMLSTVQTLAMDDCSNSSDLSKLEELQQQCAEYEREADVAVIYALVEACRLKKEALALDLARRLRTAGGCEKAVIAANKLGRPGLARALDKHMAYVRASNDSGEAEAEASSALTYESPPNDNQSNGRDSSSRRGDARRQSQSQSQSALSPSTQPSKSQLSGPTDSQVRRSSFGAAQVASIHSLLPGGADNGQSAPKPSNPFHRASPLSPEKKRKTSLSDSLRELGAASPSPKKTPLSRSSAMATEARANKLSKKTII